MRKYIITLFAALSLNSVINENFANAQMKREAIAIGGAKTDYGFSLCQTKDDGFAISGRTFSYGDTVNSDMYIVRLDSMGNLKWTTTVGGNARDEGYSIIQTSDNGFVVAGITYSYGAGGADYYVVKLDSSGNLMWAKTIGGTGDDEADAIVQTTDRGYIIAGYTSSFGAGSYDCYMVRLDSNGNVLWTRTIGGTGDDEVFSVVQTNDKGFAFAGYTSSFGAGDNDFYIIKLDSGEISVGTKTIGTPDYDNGISIIQTNDNGYAITGAGGTGLGGVYTVKLDSIGNLKWTSIISGDNYTYGFSIVQTSDRGYAIGGYTLAFGPRGSTDVFVVKLDSAGNLNWTKTITNTGDNEGWSILQTRDKGFAIGGYSNALGSGSYDMYLLKLDSTGKSCSDEISDSGRISSAGTEGTGGTVTSVDSGRVSSGGIVSSGGMVTIICDTTTSVKNIANSNTVNVYPNPTSGLVTVELIGVIEGEATLELYNVLGQKVCSSHLKPYISELNLSFLMPGIYLYRINTTHGGFVAEGKVIVE